MPTTRRQTVSAVTAWVLLCTLLNAAGWILSAIGQLNLVGYSVVFLTMGCAVLWSRQHYKLSLDTGFQLRRFKSWIPGAFALVAILTVLGGILHPPANYDALAYRTPRVLHWLAENRWHWIHADFQRLNTRGAGMEWMTAPLIVFTRTDRLFFLINVISFLLLPGLCYRILAGLGVRKKVAACWMWIIPSGYCYVLQGGSIANDLFGATLTLAAVDFALRAAKQKSAPLAWMAMLSAALMTASKGFNLLFLLPWGLAMIPTTWLLLRRVVPSFTVGVVALLISLVPTSILNVLYCGDWKGINAEPVQISSEQPLLHLGVNCIMVMLHNFSPTVMPVAGVWNRKTDEILPDAWEQVLKQSFEGGGNPFKLGELQMEEVCGIGVGVSVLLATVLIGSFRLKRPALQSVLPGLLKPSFYVPATTGLVILYFFTQSGLGCPARYLAPAYAILAVPILSLPAAERLIHKPWWRGLALFSFALAAILVVITPPRPLWPAQTLLQALGSDSDQSPILKRVWNVYSVYGQRADGFAPVRPMLPDHLQTLGLVTFDDPETSLWRPFGSIRIHHVPRNDTPEQLRGKGIETVLVSDYILTVHQRTTIDEWLKRFDAELVKSFDLTLRATRGPTRWHIVRIRPVSSAPVAPIR